jgi:hypothetical protein
MTRVGAPQPNDQGGAGGKMATDSYSGGGTLLYIGDWGVRWSSYDPADNFVRSGRGPSYRPASKKAPKKKTEVGQSIKRDKALRSFISQCAARYLASTLTSDNPTAPAALRSRILKAGGNIRWLESDRRHMISFHRALCRLLDRKIPFDKVWGPPTLQESGPRVRPIVRSGKASSWLRASGSGSPGQARR